jgi:hypothetical protein
MRWLWKREARLIEPRRVINSKLMELETAKEILAEVFHARTADIDEMIERRLEEKNWLEENEIWPEEHGEKLWPEMFCLGE